MREWEGVGGSGREWEEIQGGKHIILCYYITTNNTNSCSQFPFHLG